MTPPIPTSRWIFAGSLIAVGVFGALSVLLFWSFGVFDSLLRVDAPGRKDFTFEPGRYAVYWESPLLAAKRSRPPCVPVGIWSTRDGSEVPVSTDLFMPLNYSTLDNRHGALMYEFSIDHQAEYEIVVGNPSVSQTVPGQISLGRGLTVLAYIRLCVVPFTLFWSGVGAGLYILLRKRKTPS